MRRFFARTSQPLMQDWIVEMGKRLLRKLPVGMLTRMGLATLAAPRTRGWAGASKAIQEYIDEQHEKQDKALGLGELIDMARRDAGA